MYIIDYSGVLLLASNVPSLPRKVFPLLDKGFRGFNHLMQSKIVNHTRFVVPTQWATSMYVPSSRHYFSVIFLDFRVDTVGGEAALPNKYSLPWVGPSAPLSLLTTVGSRMPGSRVVLRLIIVI